MKMRAAVSLTAILLVTIGAAGCGGNDNGDDGNVSAVEKAEGKGQQTELQKKQEAENFSKEATPVQLLTGDRTGVRVNKPTVYIIHSKKDLDALIKQHNSHGISGEKPAAVDFTTRQAVGVFLPPQEPGTILAINDIFEQDGTIIVKGGKLLPGKGCGTGSTEPRSYAVVETRKMDTTKSKLVLTNTTGQAC